MLPFVHTGMEGILPKGATLPQAGQKVKVLFGEPIQFQDLLTQAQVYPPPPGGSLSAVYLAIH